MNPWRWGCGLGALGVTVAATAAFVDGLPATAPLGLSALQGTLFALGFAWLAWNAAVALAGLWPARRARFPRGPAAPIGRVAILVPIHNEAPDRVFNNAEAMLADLAAHGARHRFDLFILSDSTDPGCRLDEASAYATLAAPGVFYRHRQENTGRKAGNIADFVRRWGGAYAYMVVLDADSLMAATTLIALADAMDREPDLGLLQTVPMLMGRTSLFGRMMQFGGALYGPMFARGLDRVQGDAGNYWGHNAIIRTVAFAASCGLPRLRGRPPFGGAVLSHDFVEAALLRRHGWGVRLAPDLGGSFEEAPPHLMAHARRDRRWCQGNLQHLRILGAPALHPWSRINLLQGILAYLAAPIWLAFMLTSLAQAAHAELHPPVFFPDGHSLYPIWASAWGRHGLVLLLSVAGLLLVPRMITALATLAGPGAGDFGGRGRLAAGIVLETVLSALLAPVLMLFQCRAVAEVLMLGRDGGWPASDRDDGRLPWGAALAAGWWITLAGLALTGLTLALAPGLIAWLAPVAAPLVLAPALIWLTARPAPGRLLVTPAECRPDPVLNAALPHRRAAG